MQQPTAQQIALIDQVVTLLIQDPSAEPKLRANPEFGFLRGGVGADYFQNKVSSLLQAQQTAMAMVAPTQQFVTTSLPMQGYVTTPLVQQTSQASSVPNSTLQASRQQPQQQVPQPQSAQPLSQQ